MLMICTGKSIGSVVFYIKGFSTTFEMKEQNYWIEVYRQRLGYEQTRILRQDDPLILLRMKKKVQTLVLSS